MPFCYKKRVLFLVIFLTIPLLSIQLFKTKIIFGFNNCPHHSEILYPTQKQMTTSVNDNSLHAKYAAILDGDNNRLLYGKQSDTPVPMASTTKIMTCVIALEYAPADYVCTTSKYAASMPDVQLNATRGERFVLNDLLYSLMLKSHNDTAVIIAENVAYTYLCHLSDTAPTQLAAYTANLSFLADHYNNDSSFLSSLSIEDSKVLVSVFTTLMNEKASQLGCVSTHFVTPNGLDAADDNGTHSTTAKELCMILAYCIQNNDFIKITRTRQHTFTSYIVNDSQNKPYEKGISYTVSNANAFLDMYDNILTGKTGFTNNAGYCYVCAYQADGRTFIVALLACGWPNNKTYKWKDCRLLLDWARNNFFYQTLLSPESHLRTMPVVNALQTEAPLVLKDSCGLLLSANDTIQITYDIPDVLSAPIRQNTPVGSANIYINDTLYTSLPIYPANDIDKLTFSYYLYRILQKFLYIN